MAPRSFPEEIDVFTVPHSRMKELVNIYTQKVQRLDFRDGREVILLLHDLGTTLSEFKSHESIENIFIMDQLKNRLKQRQIHNTAVCDCHNDNRLSDVLQLVQTGTKVREQGMGELLSFGQELQRSFEEFVENFLTHMEEEEQVFQPLLVEHFEYDELKVLKDIVLKEHEYIKDRQNQEKANEEEPETCDIVKELRDLDLDLCCLSEESLEQESDSLSFVSSTALKEDPCLNSTYTDSALVSCKVFDASHLPTEILLEVFRYLSPQDLGSCAQVCSSWNNAAYAPTLWKAVYPVQWARGIWGWRNVWLCNTLEEKALRKQSSGFHKWDEDKDVDEAEEEEDQDPLADKEHSMLEGLVNWVLPRVGHAVKTLVVDAGSGITSRLLHQALILCPNISILSAAHTQIDYYLFKGLPGCLQKLQHLNLQGCELIDDGALECLAQCAAPDHPYLSSEYTPDPDDVQYTCPNEARENTFNESWTLNHGEPIYQYCGYCSCWRANLAPQRPNNNTSYLDNFCQNRNNQKSSYRQPSMSNSTSHRKFSYEHHSNHSTQEVHSSSKTLSNYESLNPERDIEEICCRQGSSYSTGNNIQQSNSHRSLAFEDTNEYNPNMKGQKDQFEPYSYVSSSRFQLKDLSLSGCWRVTDEGLLALVDAGVVDRLYHLDVSGCFQLTGEGLKAFMYYSQGLKAENMFYCDNIIDGPYPTQANGCANLCNPIRVCCRNGR